MEVPHEDSASCPPFGHRRIRGRRLDKAAGACGDGGMATLALPRSPCIRCHRGRLWPSPCFLSALRKVRATSCLVVSSLQPSMTG